MPVDDPHRAAPHPPVAAPPRPLLVPALAFAAGILAVRLLSAPAWIAFALAVPALAALLLSLRRRSTDRPRLAAAAVIVLAFSTGAAWFAVRTTPAPDDLAPLATPEGRIVTVDGVVVESPRQSRRPDNPLLPGAALASADADRAATSLVIDAFAVTLADDVARPASGRLRLTVAEPLPARPADQPRLGDRLHVTARLCSFSPPLNPGQADMARAFAEQGVRAALRTDSWHAVRRTPPPAWSLYGWMGALRARLRAAMPAGDSPTARILPAILIGDLPQLQDAEQQSFIRAGVIHYLAVSGLHVAVLCGLLVAALRLLLVPRRLIGLFVILFVLSYAFALELRPSVLRAAVFFTLLSLSWTLARPRDLLNTLAASAVVVLLIDPTELFGPGFQLSFLVVLGLIVVTPRLRDTLFPSRDWVRLAVLSPARRLLLRLRFLLEDFVATSLTAWLVAAPLAAWHYHLVSPIGVLATVALFPLVAAIILLGALAALATLVAAPAGAALWSLVDPLARLLDTLVTAAAHIDFGHFYVRRFDWPWGLLTVALLLAWALRPSIGPHILTRRRLAIAAAVAALAYVAFGIPRGPRDEVRITTLAVGSGNAVLVQAPGGYSLLVDAGSDLLADRSGEYVIVPALWRLGVARLDAVLLTHSDADHVKDLPTLLARIPARRIYLPPDFETPGKSYDDRVLRWITDQGLDVVRVSRGDLLLDRDGARIRVLDPPAGRATSEESNDASVVLRISNGPEAVILTGDATPAHLAALADSPDASAPDGLAARYLLLPHHGQQSPEAVRFIRAADARSLIISVGRYRDTRRPADFHWPDDRALYRTWQSGAVTVHLRPAGAYIEPFRRPDP